MLKPSLKTFYCSMSIIYKGFCYSKKYAVFGEEVYDFT